MKKLIAIGLVLLSTSAWAEWVELARNKLGTVYYIDPATKKTIGRPRVWTFVVYGNIKSNGTLSYRALHEADCQNEMSRDLSSIYYTDLGTIVNSIADQPDPWGYPPPGSPHMSLFNYLCAPP